MQPIYLGFTTHFILFANTSISWALTQKIIYFLGWIKIIIIADLLFMIIVSQKILFMIIYNAFDYLFKYTYLLSRVKNNIVYMQRIYHF